MSRKSPATTDETPEVEAEVTRTEPMEVSPELSVGLLAAWDGVYHFLGGRVDGWEITPDGIIAHGFTVPSTFDPEVILTDVNRRERRVQLFPAIYWLNGSEPADFSNPQEVQAYLTQYFKGSTDDGSTKAAKYIRDAAKAYRARVMGTNRPGPKPQIFKKLASLDASQLRNIPVSDLDHLESILQEVRASQAAAEIVPA